MEKGNNQVGFIVIAGAIYIFYNAYKGKPKKMFTKIFCIISGFLFALVAIYYGMMNEWEKIYFPIGNVIIAIITPFIAKSLEKRK